MGHIAKKIFYRKTQIFFLKFFFAILIMPSAKSIPTHVFTNLDASKHKSPVPQPTSIKDLIFKCFTLLIT